MRLVIIESPYAGDIAQNLEYARLCVRDSLSRGEAPIASHLLYTQTGLLNDSIPIERTQGIDAGHAWFEVADAIIFYTDLGISNGMDLAFNKVRGSTGHAVVEYRQLGSITNQRSNDNASNS